MSFTFKKLEVSELTKAAAFEAAQQTDNFKLNLACQVIIFGNIEPLNTVGIEGLRAVNFMEMRSLVPAKFIAKDNKWELDKKEAEKVRGDLMVKRDDSGAIEELAGNLYQIIKDARKDAEAKIKVETQRISAEKEDKKKAKEAEAKKGESKVEAVKKAIEKEVKRGGDEFTAEMILEAMIKQIGKLPAQDAMIALLESQGYAVEKVAAPVAEQVAEQA